MLDKKLKEIQKQAEIIEMEMKRARTAILDEYIQTKAANQKTLKMEPKTKPANAIASYMPSYLKGYTKPKMFASDYLDKMGKE